MDCAQIDREDLRERYLAGTLKEAEQDAFEVHLLECRSCQDDVAALHLVRKQGAGLPDRPTERGQAVGSWWAAKPWVWAAAASVVVVAVVSGTYEMRQQRRAPEPAVTASVETQPVRTLPPIGPAPTSGLNIGVQLEKARKRAEDAQEAERKETAAGQEKTAAQPGEVVAQAVAIGDPKEKSSELPSNERNHVSLAMTNSTVDRDTDCKAGECAHQEFLPEEDQKAIFRMAQVNPPAYNFADFPKDVLRDSRPSAFYLSGNPSRLAARREQANKALEDGMRAYVEKRYPDARTSLSQAAELRPESILANFFLGIVELAQGDAKAAIAHLEKVAKQDARDYQERAHFYLAKAYLSHSDFEAAEEQLKAAQQYQGTMRGEVHTFLTELRAMRKKFAEREAPNQED
jgi:TPR repeat protein